MHIQGCSHLGDLKNKFQHIKWIRTSLNPEESHQKMKTMKQMGDGNNYPSKVAKNFTNQLDRSDELDGYFADISNRENANLSFGQGFYKRSKLLDARKSSAVLSRDAQMRRLMQRQAESGYRKMEEFIISRLREIMKSNRFEFFIPKVPSPFYNYLNESSDSLIRCTNTSHPYLFYFTGCQDRSQVEKWVLCSPWLSYHQA